MKIEDKVLRCQDCGSDKKVEFIQQKKGDPLQWGHPWPACLKCRKKAMGSYRLNYGFEEEPVQKEQDEVVINNYATLAPQREVIVRIVNHQRAIEPTFGWFMFLVTVLAMIIVPFIWFIVSGHWLVVK